MTASITGDCSSLDDCSMPLLDLSFPTAAWRWLSLWLVLHAQGANDAAQNAAYAEPLKREQAACCKDNGSMLPWHLLRETHML